MDYVERFIVGTLVMRNNHEHWIIHDVCDTREQADMSAKFASLMANVIDTEVTSKVVTQVTTK
jgi:myo-inositol catabolism protein IolC